MAQNEKKVAILIEQQYQEMEAWYPYYRLKEEGIDVAFIGPEGDKNYYSKLGYPAKSHVAVDVTKAKDYDGFIVPGGFAPDFMRRHHSMIEFLKSGYENAKPVAAICHGGWMLCSIGALKGVRATSFFAIKDDLINAGAQWVDEEVVKDKNIVTSRTPADLPAFTKAFLHALRETA